MNIVLTGSLGHISKPLAMQLLANGHSVTIISTKIDRKKDIETLGATAAIGRFEDLAFLENAFKGADIAYVMEPPVSFFDPDLDIMDYYKKIARNFKQAILQAGVTKIVHLSSIGAHTDKGNGMLKFHYEVENILKELPKHVSIKTMRPVGFYYNMFAFIPAIKNAGAIIQNYGGDEKEPWVSPKDIAAAIAEEIENGVNGRTVRYIASDEVSPNDVAKILGEAIEKADLKWLAIPDEQFQNNLINIGFSPQAAKGLTEMNAGRKHNLYDDYHKNKPTLSNTKLKDFAKDFATVYSNENKEH